MGVEKGRGEKEERRKEGRYRRERGEKDKIEF